MAVTGNDIGEAARLILAGELVAIPTETVYGLAANALDEKAVLSIFEAKQRPFFDPLIIHLPSLETARKYASFNNKKLEVLAEKFWPGPLTILLPKKNNIPSIVTSGLELVAVRVPQHPVTLKLLEKINVPLAAPSANPFGYISPTQPSHVEKQLGHKISYILDGGICEIGIESTIVGVEDGQVCVYRLGGLEIDKLEKICGTVLLRINNSSDPKAPGQLKNHYAPVKPLYVGYVAELIKQHRAKKISLLHFGAGNIYSEMNHLYNLSPESNIHEAALNLFNFLRKADEDDSDLVICEVLPEQGLGAAINDRLRRAATKLL